MQSLKTVQIRDNVPLLKPLDLKKKIYRVNLGSLDIEYVFKRIFISQLGQAFMATLILFFFSVIISLLYLQMNRTISCPQQCLKAPYPILNQPPTHLQLQAKIKEEEQSEKEKIQTKNQKWTDRQHVLYLLFLEENREKIKSRLIRRSNSFYREMALFIGNKTGVQCRSHHQKYETKYKFPHKIIKFEKERVNPLLYASVLDSFRNNESKHQSSPLQETAKVEQTQEVQQKQVSCQTEIQGTQTAFLVYDNYMLHHRLMQNNFQPCFSQERLMNNQWNPSAVYPFLWSPPFP